MSHDVAVRAPPRSERAVGVDLRLRAIHERGEHRNESGGERLLVAAVQLAGREVESHVRGEQAERGQGSGMRRDDHGCDREAPRELGGVERAGTAEGDERVISRIVPTLAECHPDGALHRRVHHLDGSARPSRPTASRAPRPTARSQRARARRPARGGSPAGSPASAVRGAAGSRSPSAPCLRGRSRRARVPSRRSRARPEARRRCRPPRSTLRRLRSSSTSIAGRRIGISPTVSSVLVRGSKPPITETSALVPPMSKQTRSAWPVVRASRVQATTPATGPDSASVTGRDLAAAGVSAPPFDCVTKSDAAQPASARADSSRVRYVSTSGISAALRTVVAVRSYSRSSRESSAEAHTNQPSCARSMAAICCSWSALR